MTTRPSFTFVFFLTANLTDTQLHRIDQAIDISQPPPELSPTLTMFSTRQPASVPLASDPSIRRSYLSPDKLVTRPAGDQVTVVGDLFSYAVSPLSRYTSNTELLS
jgi:hypothetical protein